MTKINDQVYLKVKNYHFKKFNTTIISAKRQFNNNSFFLFKNKFEEKY